MSCLTIYRDSALDSTLVSNRFIDDYMKEANDAQIKIYLYLIRLLSANINTSISDIADKFNHTEKDVLRALKYWEKNQILTLDYDDSKNLIGVHLNDLPDIDSKKSSSTLAPVVSIVDKQPASIAAASAQMSSQASIQTSAQTPVREIVKPSYSLDQLKEFKSREETAQLLFIVESYMGKPLTPNEIKSILFFTDELHFSDDLIDYLVQYCLGRGKRDFKYMEAVAINWAAEGISTPKQAEKFSYKYDKIVYNIMNALGKGGSPTTKELEFIQRWINEYAFGQDVITEACERTVLATDKHRFEYCEGILSNWKKADVHRKSDIARIDELYQKRRASSPTKTASQTANKFNQFKQNDYDFDALEQEFMSN